MVASSVSVIDGLYPNLEEVQGLRSIGKWLKASRDDCRLVLSKIRQAEADRVADPVPWIGEAIKPAWSTDPVERQMRQSF
jgi:hypothetical protein